jgi:hypothetical protein
MQLQKQPVFIIPPSGTLPVTDSGLCIQEKVEQLKHAINAVAEATGFLFHYLEIYLSLTPASVGEGGAAEARDKCSCRSNRFFYSTIWNFAPSLTLAPAGEGGASEARDKCSCRSNRFFYSTTWNFTRP